MKEIIKRLKIAYLVLTGKVRFDQRTISIQDIDKRLETILSKYTTEKYRSINVVYHTLTDNIQKGIDYRLYTAAFGGISNLSVDSSSCSSLEDAFIVFENELKKKSNPSTNKETENLTIEI